MTADGLFFYFIAFMTMGGIYAILCLALNMQWGFGGLFNAGIAGFYAVGAYTAAIITSANSPSHLGGFDLPIVLGLIAAGVLSGIVGWGIARICVRLKAERSFDLSSLMKNGLPTAALALPVFQDHWGSYSADERLSWCLLCSSGYWSLLRIWWHND